MERLTRRVHNEVSAKKAYPIKFRKMVTLINLVDCLNLICYLKLIEFGYILDKVLSIVGKKSCGNLFFFFKTIIFEDNSNNFILKSFKLINWT